MRKPAITYSVSLTISWILIHNLIILIITFYKWGKIEYYCFINMVPLSPLATKRYFRGERTWKKRDQGYPTSSYVDFGW